MEKYNSDQHSNFVANLPFSYFSTHAYLDFAAYTFKRNGENLIVWQDILYSHEFPSIFLPTKKANWIRCSIGQATEEDITKIKNENIAIDIKKPLNCEYFYETKSFLNPTGKFKNRVNQFKNGYRYENFNSYDKEKVLDFYNFWRTQKKHSAITFEESEAFFYFCLDNLDKYDIKQIYIEADGKLIGFAWGIAHQSPNNWIGLQLKVNYQYKGLSRYLHHERAKLFKESELFSIGNGADKGIEKYKEELGPVSKRQYYYLLTGEKLK